MIRGCLFGLLISAVLYMALFGLVAFVMAPVR